MHRRNAVADLFEALELITAEGATAAHVRGASRRDRVAAVGHSAGGGKPSSMPRTTTDRRAYVSSPSGAFAPRARSRFMPDKAVVLHGGRPRRCRLARGAHPPGLRRRPVAETVSGSSTRSVTTASTTSCTFGNGAASPSVSPAPRDSARCSTPSPSSSATRGRLQGAERAGAGRSSRSSVTPSRRSCWRGSRAPTPWASARGRRRLRRGRSRSRRSDAPTGAGRCRRGTVRRRGAVLGVGQKKPSFCGL